MLSLLGYCAYDHWQKIRIFPRETRQALRLALHAERRGASETAEGHYHDALRSSLQSAGRASVQTVGAAVCLYVSRCLRGVFCCRWPSFTGNGGRPDRAVRIYQAIASENHPSCLHQVEIIKALGDALVEAGRPHAALASYSELWHTLEASEEGRRLAADPSVVGPIHEGLGNAQVCGRSYEAAAVSYEKALELCRMDEAGCGARNQVVLLNNIASCHLAMGGESSVERAHEAAQLALDTIERKGLVDEEMLQIRTNLLEALAAQA